MSDKQISLEKWASLLDSKKNPSSANASKLPETKTLDSKSASSSRDDLLPSSDTAMASSESVVEKSADNPIILSVSGLNGALKHKIEGEFQTVWLQGEISNFKPHTSGHYYLSLKDDKSQISAVMFKGFNARLKFRPENGMEVLVRGRVTVYEPRGSYQVFCETMEPVGAGALQKAFEQLKAKLQAEGLFDQKYKKALPVLPKRIGVVTSPTGAAIQDILNVLNRRYRSAHITVIPARVQGDGSALEVVRGIELANRVGNFDVLIVGRGGGSIEDMWGFNEEIVARAIFASVIPIISAVGHEIDYTIADFVADYRAPTPSAAAEVVAQSVSQLLERIKNHEARLLQRLQFQLSHWLQRLHNFQSRLVDPQRHLEDLSIRCDEAVQRLQMAWQRYHREKVLQVRLLRQKLKNPRDEVRHRRDRVTQLAKNLNKEMKNLLQQRRTHTDSLMSLMDSLSPLKVLNRGYAVIFKGDKIIRSPKQATAGDKLTVQVEGGALEVQVVSETKKKIEF
jgi:exodeoxyribonuclease VII large subunit